MPETSPSIQQRNLLVAIDNEPNRSWTAESLIDTTGMTVIDVMVALAHLTYSHQIERCAVGQYRSRRHSRPNAS